ncbi:hypothetical protein E6C60_3899 [Paenibacillus algicola]|uniref:Uncharacterized protein n=1 Tax=Paenibacillus algicola TaxID=2565926 RepID=A0A4V1G4G4_9BACL|nr:hypothetical protein E6C60_3899 [Paenibacillus algicola]
MALNRAISGFIALFTLKTPRFFPMKKAIRLLAQLNRFFSDYDKS